MFFGSRSHRPTIGFTPEALEALKRYSWPGNIRELSNVIERSAILGITDRIGVEHLPALAELRDAPPCIGDRVPIEKIEEQHIRRVLATAKTLQEAAEILGIDHATLWRRRKKYGI